ncbi:MAG: hypothetical protein JWL90_4628 [Chthoniobacteraceae bacterium]|nr:hypothetical protein [Chthoniobacteraceae bacterium]
MNLKMSLLIAVVLRMLPSNSYGEKAYVVAEQGGTPYTVEVEFDVPQGYTLFTSPPTRVRVYSGDSAKEVLRDELEEPQRLTPVWESPRAEQGRTLQEAQSAWTVRHNFDNDIWRFTLREAGALRINILANLRNPDPENVAISGIAFDGSISVNIPNLINGRSLQNFDRVQVFHVLGVNSELALITE